MARFSFFAVVAVMALAACTQQEALVVTPGDVSVQAVGDVWINEIRIDQPSTDADEYFELAGPPEASLEGLTYLVIGDGTYGVGGSGVIEAVVSLAGQALSADGFLVAAKSTFTLGTADLTTDLNFENSDNVTHLLVSGFTGADGDDLDTNDDGTLDVEPWSEVLDSVALIETVGSGERVYSATQVGPDGSFVPGHVYRCTDGWRIGAFGGGDDTPGSENACSTVPSIGVCGNSATLISEVQGSGFDSPLDGDAVVIEGVVVGDFQDGDGDPFDTDLAGFYLQEEAADWDANDATSEGIFVFDPDAVDVQVGDVVRVVGTVDEFQGLTELTDVAELLVCGSGEAPEPVEVKSLPIGDVERERLEGMLIEIEDELVISEYFNFDRFGEIVLAQPNPKKAERQFQPTSFVEPGLDAAAEAEENALRRITLDDGRTSQNPDPARHPNGEVFALSNRFRGGDEVKYLVGIMDYRFGQYRIQPTAGAEYEVKNERPESPEDVGGELTVAAFNVLNYFLTIDSGPDVCGAAQNMDCRGADTVAEFERQRAKILSALSAIEADVFGLIEMENTPGVEPLADLVAGLNGIFGAGTYAYVDTGVIGTDAIRVGFIYKATTVTPAGDHAVLDSTVDSRFDDDRNRPVLAQSFMQNSSGEVFTAAVNHLKSKGSSCGAGDDDPQQGNCNLTRTLAAEALVDWLASDPTGSGDADVMILGDLNAYDEEDPIRVLLDAGYVDLVEEEHDEFVYTYVFNGQFGHLDYALANESLTEQVKGAANWHINADEPDILDYDMTFKRPAQDALFEANPFRSSDHDPVVVGLDLED